MDNDIKTIKNQVSHLCVAMEDMTKYASSIFDRLGEHDVLLNAILGRIVEISLECVVVEENATGEKETTATSTVEKEAIVTSSIEKAKVMTSSATQTPSITSRASSPSFANLADSSIPLLTTSKSSPSIANDVITTTLKVQQNVTSDKVSTSIKSEDIIKSEPLDVASTFKAAGGIDQREEVNSSPRPISPVQPPIATTSPTNISSTNTIPSTSVGAVTSFRAESPANTLSTTPPVNIASSTHTSLSSFNATSSANSTPPINTSITNTNTTPLATSSVNTSSLTTPPISLTPKTNATSSKSATTSVGIIKQAQNLLSPFSSPKSKRNRHVIKKQKDSCDSGIFSDDVISCDEVSDDVIKLTSEAVDKAECGPSADKKQAPTCDVKIEINSPSTSVSDVTDKKNGAATRPAELRRNSFSGISLRSHDNNKDSMLINKRSNSACDMTSVGNTPKSDAGDTCADRRLLEVARQHSNTSTSSAPCGIDIVVGAESESDDDDIEKRLPDLPPCKFSHRQVQVKSSTYKHFYELKEAIGGGRFGRVHRCVEKKTGLSLAAKLFLCKKPVAKSLLKSKSLKRATQNLKTKRTNQEPVEKEDVMMEIAIMNQIDHVNIVKLYDAYENDNTMTLIIEYLGGGELFERVLMDQSQLTELDAVLFMRQIIKAVQYLHKNLILHLDLKPENILCLDRSTHHLKIIDFGLARKYIPRHKLIVQWGTPEFMAPEVLNYDVVSFPSDMWSVGVICFILLSGLSPFLGEDDAETMDNISECEWNFDDFDSVSDQAKDFISRLLVEEKSGRMSASQCLRHDWLATPLTSKRRKALINKSQLKNFMARMHWKASIAAVSAANWLRQKVGNDSVDTAV